MKDFWAHNLAALGQRTDPGTVAWVEDMAARGPGSDKGFRDRQGTILPGVVDGGKARALVSTFDKEREAARWASEVQGGAVAILGAGGVEAVRALINQGCSLIFSVEPRPEVWQSLLTWQDWTEVAILDGWVPFGGNAAGWEALVKDRYHPLWDGGFRTLDWRAAVQGNEPTIGAYREATLRALDALAADTSTQARFGERWYRNTLLNLKNLVPGEVQGCQGAKVVIAGAGPGLDDALEDPVQRRWIANRGTSGDRLFSTDTAFPALLARGVRPDLVLCLDGQLPTYHHFVPGRPRVPLVADLASLPLLGRLGMPVVRYLSGNPLGRIVRRFFPEIPWLDGSLGNVSGLALRTAQALGARQVETWGVDFSYRNGQAYAHGTYVYDLASRKVGRMSPFETLLGASCYAARGVERTRDSQGRALDTTPLLRDYRLRWETMGPPAPAVSLVHGGAETRWEAFRNHWTERLQSLPLPGKDQPVHNFVRNLPQDRREDWLALWPLALALHRGGLAGPALVETVRSKALSFLQD